AMTAGMLILLYKKRPDLLVKMRVVKPGRVPQEAGCRAILGAAVLLGLSFVFLSPHPARAGEKWTGVDESVVEKYAKEHGREKRLPFINTDQGDLLLFVFLLAGSVGGFTAGYYWRELIVEKPSPPRHKMPE
ncbi:MAG TPA: cobalamin biosynthesis protein CbiM, partial [Geobacteraceae bacterium]|nr:cobalamin biosynthesis protein CbiM [Geobacteraceae bacterium]